MDKRQREELKSKVTPVAQKYGLDAVYLFGSRARGEETATSDYDFFIRRGKLRGLFQLSGLFQDLQAELASQVDIILDPEGVGSVPDYMLAEINRDKVLLYAR